MRVICKVWCFWGFVCMFLCIVTTKTDCLDNVLVIKLQINPIVVRRGISIVKELSYSSSAWLVLVSQKLEEDRIYFDHSSVLMFLSFSISILGACWGKKELWILWIHPSLPLIFPRHAPFSSFVLSEHQLQGGVVAILYPLICKQASPSELRGTYF